MLQAKKYLYICTANDEFYLVSFKQKARVRFSADIDPYNQRK